MKMIPSVEAASPDDGAPKSVRNRSTRVDAMLTGIFIEAKKSVTFQIYHVLLFDIIFLSRTTMLTYAIFGAHKRSI